MNFVKEKMTTFNQLKGGVIFTDQIPRSIAGKIQRRDLKKMAQAQAASAADEPPAAASTAAS